jgi:hypothetical protein
VGRVLCIDHCTKRLFTVRTVNPQFYCQLSSFTT